jgi:putative FmdB family regulatory protein
MPLYEYQCKKCGKIFEVMQKFSDEPLKKHEGCGGKVEKQMSAPAFHLKGTGWYVTDYGKGGVVPKNPSPESGSESKSESSSESKSDSSAEMKSEAKSETKSEAKPATKSESKSKKPAASSSK